MTHIKLYGQPTSVYEYLKSILQEEAKKAGIQIELEEIQDVQQIIDNSIESIPTVQINDNERFQLKMESVQHLAEEARLALLRAENFGNMKQLIVPVDFSSTASNALDYALALEDQQKFISLQSFHHQLPGNLQSIVQDMEIEELPENIDFESDYCQILLKLEFQFVSSKYNSLISSATNLGL